MPAPATGYANCFADLDVREDILAALDAAHTLSGKSFLMTKDGGFCYYTGRRDAYSCYGLPMRGVWADASDSPYILAVTAEGDVLNATSSTLTGQDVIDAARKTHGTNTDAHLLTADRHVYYHNPWDDAGPAVPLLPTSAPDRGGITAIAR